MRYAIYAAPLAACAALLSLAVARPVCAAPAPAAAPVFGSVDIQKVIDSYQKKSGDDAKLQTTSDLYQAAYETLQNNAMLSGDDLHTLGSLLGEANPSPADKQKIADLETKSQADSSALATLSQKKDLTDADKVRLTQLTTEQKNGQQAIQDIASAYRDQLSAQNQSMSQQVASDIKAAVASVAEQKGLAVVFDAQVAIYTSTDVTQAVINKLNGTK